MDSQNRVQWVYSSRNNQELAERYDQWAKDYDRDLDHDFKWLGPQRAAEVFARYVTRDSRILDAGAGTGLVGKFLAENGYHQINAMDMSVGMLEEARKKNVYQDFHQMVMGSILGFDSGSFDAVISVGVLTVGHAPASSLDELVRITRPGGYVVFSLRPDVYESAGFKEKQAELESAGKWNLIEEGEKFQPLPKGEPEVLHQVWVYQVCRQPGLPSTGFAVNYETSPLGWLNPGSPSNILSSDKMGAGSRMQYDTIYIFARR